MDELESRIAKALHARANATPPDPAAWSAHRQRMLPRGPGRAPYPVRRIVPLVAAAVAVAVIAVTAMVAHRSAAQPQTATIGQSVPLTACPVDPADVDTASPKSAAAAIGVSGCADPTSAMQTVSPVRSSASEPATSSAARDVGATIPYDLLTHCGIREALIDNNYYVASPVLDDGNGNPPTGWGNPYNSGTMTINPDNTADFHDAAGHRAHFVLRPGATTWLQVCS